MIQVNEGDLWGSPFLQGSKGRPSPSQSRRVPTLGRLAYIFCAPVSEKLLIAHSVQSRVLLTLKPGFPGLELVCCRRQRGCYHL